MMIIIIIKQQQQQQQQQHHVLHRSTAMSVSVWNAISHITILEHVLLVKFIV